MSHIELLELAKDKTEAGRNALTDAVCKMLGDDLTESEKQLASEIMLSLLRQAELDLRQALSERLSVMDDAPADLIEYLAHDEIDVARSVLQKSHLLSDEALVTVIEVKSAEYWNEIAKRSDISPRVTLKLVETENPSTILCLLENERTTIDRHSMDGIVKQAYKSEALHAPILRRPEVNSDLAINLYWCVSTELRQQIVSNYNVNTKQLDEALEGVVQEFVDASVGANTISSGLVTIAEQFKAKGDINSEMLINALRRRQNAFFITLVASSLEIEPQFVSQMMQKEGGECLAVICRCMDVAKSEFASVFLLSRGGRSGDKIVDQRELALALKCFDGISMAKSERLIKTWSEDPALIGHLDI